LNEFGLKFRKSRTVLGDFDLGVQTKLTVFLGFYNGESYFRKILQELEAQIDQNFYLIAVDNDSVDSTWEMMQQLLNAFPNRVKVVKNPLNVGGAGTIAMNFDLIQTEWWCAVHQDDSYKRNFTQHFNTRLSQVKNDVVSISADMGSINGNGKKNAIPPRISWLIKDSNPFKAFSSNIRVQTVPYPATAFKTSVYRECISPWHSPTFSDSETTLRMCAYGIFEFTNQLTMNYREHEMSESRSLNNFESRFGIGVSLIRVFSSQEFFEILRMLDPKSRESFLTSINNSIDARLGDSEFSKFIKLIASENCMVIWNYEERSSKDIVKKYFSDMGSSFTPELLDRISVFSENSDIQEQRRVSPETQQFLADFLNTADSKVYENYSSRGFVRKTYDGFMKYLPIGFQKKIGTFLIRFKVTLNKSHPWNIN
jgi:glycosyltransferase involved in cell wall biosynthesis